MSDASNDRDFKVEAELNYLAPMPERPRTYTFAPPPGTPQTNVVNEPHLLPIFDVRPHAGDFTLEGQGFALLDHRSEVTNFDDEQEIPRHLLP